MLSAMRPPTFVHETAEVADGATVGSGTKVWHQAQVLPGAIVGRDCTLGKGSFIGAGSVLGDRVKVGNYANVFGAQVGDGAFIGPAVLLMEDPAPRSLTVDGGRKGPQDWTPNPVTIGPGATVGGGAAVLPGVVVGTHAFVAAASVVHRDVPDHAKVAGHPARQVGWVCRCGQPLDEALCCGCGRTHSLADGGLVEHA